MPKPAVIIFSSLLLPPSQTFIRDPAEMLQAFTPYYVGSRRVNGLALPGDRTFVINPGNPWGKLQEQIFKLNAFAPSLDRHLQTLKPLLIHAQFGLSGALILPWVERLNLPLIVHYRGADATLDPNAARYTSLNQWVYARRLPRLQQRTHLFLTVSDFIRQRLLAQGFPPAKIRTHYHGVDVDRFQPDPHIPREPVVLFVGRLTAKKGVNVLLKAMAQVQAHCPAAQLVIIGDGPLRPALEATAQDELSHYQFLGVQPPDVVRAWMNRAQVLAAPSITAATGDAEGLPNVVQEAQAMGLPVVSTFHAGIPEAVIPHQTGFLTPEQDHDGLAHYLLQLLQDRDLWQRLSLGGRSHMVAQFNRARQTEQLEAIYREVLAGNR